MRNWGDEDVDWIFLASDRVLRRVFVNKVMHLRAVSNGAQ